MSLSTTEGRPSVDKNAQMHRLPILEALLIVGQKARHVTYSEEQLDRALGLLEKHVKEAHDKGAGLDELVMAAAVPEGVVRGWLGLIEKPETTRWEDKQIAGMDSNAASTQDQERAAEMRRSAR